MEDKEIKQTKQPEKMSYEQLENIAHQLSEQSRSLAGKLQEANLTNLFRRLDYLFLVVQNSDKFKTSFVGDCIEEIQTLLSVTEDPKEKNPLAEEETN